MFLVQFFVTVVCSCSVVSMDLWSCSVFETPWTVAHQGPLSMGFPRQEHWSGLLLSSPGNLPDPGIKPSSPALVEVLYPPSHRGSPLSVTYN